jgi:hypothetical protein
VFFVDGVDVINDLGGAIPKEKPRVLSGADAVELEIAAAEAALPDTEGIVKAQISAAFTTAGECGRRRGQPFQSTGRLQSGQPEQHCRQEQAAYRT